MNGKLTVIPAKKFIVMDRTFAKYFRDTMSEEYAHLRESVETTPCLLS